MHAYILAAGMGTRMKSLVPKVLLKLGNKPIIFHAIQNLIHAGISNITVIIGYKASEVQDAISKEFPAIKFIKQVELSGTGEAVKEVVNKSEVEEDILVLNGDDSAFYNPKDIESLINHHAETHSEVSMFLTLDEAHKGYRKVYLNTDGSFKSLSKTPVDDGYTVTGFYIFNTATIRKYLNNEKPNGELKLTDFMYDSKFNKSIFCYIISPSTWFGINTPQELHEARKRWKKLHT